MIDRILAGLGLLLPSLVPPRGHGEPREVIAWRWKMFLAVMAIGGFMLIHILLACGWLTILHPGFASAGDLKQVIAQLETQRISVVDAAILDLRIRHCAAQTPESRQLYWGKMAPLMSEYQRVTGRPYQLPMCADL